MENIVESIYRSCDEKNADSVPVSALIAFIKPYMQGSVNELVQLQTQLDPDNTDCHISYDSFQRVMSDWIANMQTDNTNTSLSDIPLDVPQTFSSSVSGDVKSNNTGVLEEEIQNLKLQLNKATNELDLVKKQLAASEEQNELLMADLISCHKKQNKEQCNIEAFNKSEHESEELEEKNRKYEELQRILAKTDKQQQKYLAQINHLESENQRLENRLQTFEKIRRQSRDSISEMHDCLDQKDAEIATLWEVIENQKCELEDKRDLLSFYTNEHKLLKQRIRELETTLQKNIAKTVESELTHFDHVFNTPKLLNQLANPVTPTLRGPITKGFTASSPLKNSSSESGNGSSCNLFSNTSALAASKSPQKTLKDELAEAPREIVHKVDELDHFYNVVKDQEDIKNNLWQEMKKLSVDNEDYKKEYFEMKRELNLMKEKNKLQQYQKQCRREQHAELLTQELTKVEENLKQQQLINADLQTTVEVLSHTLNADRFETHEEFIQRLLKKLKFFKASFRKEKLLNESLFKKLMKAKTTCKATQTDEVPDWNVIGAVEQTETKKNSFVKQQIKIDRLLEKQEKLEKELCNEKSINTKLSMKYQAVCTDNEKMKKTLDSCNETISEQRGVLTGLEMERDVLLEKLEAMKCENVDLETEINRVQDELAGLKHEKHVLDENLQSALNRLGVEATTNNNLCVENEFLRRKQCQLEKRVKEEIAHIFNLKKQLTDLQALHFVEVTQLQDELIEKRTEIRTLKKQFEIFDLESFMSACNRELHRAIQNFLHCSKSEHDWTLNLPNLEDLQESCESTFSLENEMSRLNSNVNLVVSLLKRISDKHLNFSGWPQDTEKISGSVDEAVVGSNDTEMDISNDESFDSCLSDISYSAQEIEEIVSLEFDSFLDNLQLEHVDYRRVSQKEMEEKFVTLALLLTVDVTTSKKRSVNEKKKLHQLFFTFFSSLNYITHLLNKLNDFEKHKELKTAVAHVRQLRDVSEHLIRTVFGWGVLHYEIRTLDCWKFVLNYVAVLSQENTELKKTKSCESCLGVQSLSPQVPNDQSSVMKSSEMHFWSRIKFSVCTFLLIFIVVFVALTFYVDHLCPKYGKTVCPLEWMMSLVIETHIVTY